MPNLESGWALAGDVMKTKVLTLGPQTTLSEAARLFAKEGISGAPVVGPGRKLLGVVSQADLMRRQAQADKVPAFYKDEAVELVEVGDSPGPTPVSKIMTPAVLCAAEDTPVAELARFMLAHRVHRVLITRRGALRGIVTTMDMLRLIAAPVAAARRGPRRQSRKPGRRFAGRGVPSGRRAQEAKR